MHHAGRYPGKRALIVLGGPSGSAVESLRQSIRFDVILGGNGVNQMVHDLDYWMCAENMTRSARLARQGEPRSVEFMKMFYRSTGDAVRLISHRSWHLLKDTTGCIRIRRKGYEGVEQMPAGFSFREYGEGYLSGPLLKHKTAGVPVRAGTVGLHLLHHAGILGCSEVHTIGYDLAFKREDAHHWYKYPAYQPDRFRNESMFVDYQDLKTQWIWVETAEFLKELEPLFELDGITWIDHSNGLLSSMGLRCTQRGKEYAL
jgi:hypothetical protein